MCDKWKADGYENDSEWLVRGLYRANLQAAYDAAVEVKDLELVGLTNEPAKIARAVLTGNPPNLIGSKILDGRIFFRQDEGGFHGPLFDFDKSSTRWKRSSTEGHHHLIVDEYVIGKDYANLLEAMERAGLQQHGFVAQYEKYGQTFLRWNTTKDEEYA